MTFSRSFMTINTFSVVFFIIGVPVTRIIQSLYYALLSIGKPRVSPLLSLNTSAVMQYLICIYASHFFAGRPYHLNQTLRTKTLTNFIT
jgi:hypothetical protein